MLSLSWRVSLWVLEFYSSLLLCLQCSNGDDVLIALLVRETEHYFLSAWVYLCLTWFLDTVWESPKMLSVWLVVVLTSSMSSLIFKGKDIGNSFPGEAWEPVASTTVRRIVIQVKWGKQYAHQQSVGRHVMSWGLECRYGCSSRDRRLDLSRYFHQAIQLQGTELWTAQQRSEP